jgi:hypothetical protein
MVNVQVDLDGRIHPRTAPRRDAWPSRLSWLLGDLIVGRARLHGVRRHARRGANRSGPPCPWQIRMGMWFPARSWICLAIADRSFRAVLASVNRQPAVAF